MQNRLDSRCDLGDQRIRKVSGDESNRERLSPSQTLRQEVRLIPEGVNCFQNTCAHLRAHVRVARYHSRNGRHRYSGEVGDLAHPVALTCGRDCCARRTTTRSLGLWHALPTAPGSAAPRLSPSGICRCHYSIARLAHISLEPRACPDRSGKGSRILRYPNLPDPWRSTHNLLVDSPASMIDTVLEWFPGTIRNLRRNGHLRT